MALVGYIVDIGTVELFAEDTATNIPPGDWKGTPMAWETVIVVVDAAGTVVKTAPELVVKALGIVVSCVSVKVVEDT